MSRLLEDFPDLDDQTRSALVAYGGPLRFRHPRDFPKYSCQRPTPKQHPNRNLTGPLEEVQAIYDATGDRRRETAFGRSLAVIRAWPRRIRAASDLDGAPYIGDSLLELVEEILSSGTCERLADLRRNPSNLMYMEINQLHGVGPAVARRFIGAGYTSIQQILDELDVAYAGCERGAEAAFVPHCDFVARAGPTEEQLLGIRYFR